MKPLCPEIEDEQQTLYDVQQTHEKGIVGHLGQNKCSWAYQGVPINELAFAQPLLVFLHGMKATE